MAAHDPDARRAAAIKANAELWLNMTPDQRRAHMGSVIDSMRRNLAQIVDPNGELDEPELERRLALKRKQMLAAASARGLEVRRANSAERRRRKSDEELDGLITVILGHLADENLFASVGARAS